MPRPVFAAGTNIALKAPHHRFADTVRFYRDVLGLPLLGHSESSESFPTGSPAFDFGGLRLWVDDVPSFSRSDVWLQVRATDLPAAMEHLRHAGVPVRDELEPLGDFPGHWISDPAGNVLLVSHADVESTVIPAD
jgi:catechol 2,3-dioxygenase-like lactoylglutathione lyase family enzyme